MAIHNIYYYDIYVYIFCFGVLFMFLFAMMFTRRGLYEMFMFFYPADKAQETFQHLPVQSQKKYQKRCEILKLTIQTPERRH